MGVLRDVPLSQGILKSNQAKKFNIYHTLYKNGLFRILALGIQYYIMNSFYDPLS